MLIKFLVLGLISSMIFSGCDKEHEKHAEDKPKPPKLTNQPYSLVAIEMAMLERERIARQPNDPPRIYYNQPEYCLRMFHAGPAILPEFAQALESSVVENRQLAGCALRYLTEDAKWPEAYNFIVKRLARLPPGTEAGQLLLAVAHEGISTYSAIVPYAAYYLADESFILSYVDNSPINRQDARTCDFAAYVLQVVSKEDFGAFQRKRNQDAVDKARAWAKKNPDKVRVLEEK